MDINLLKESQVFCESIEAAADKIGCVIAARKDAEADQLTLLAGKILKTI